MGNAWGIVLHPRDARDALPGLSLSIGGGHRRVTAAGLADGREARQPRQAFLDVGAAAASQSVTGDTKAAIRPPGEEAYMRWLRLDQ